MNGCTAVLGNNNNLPLGREMDFLLDKQYLLNRLIIKKYIQFREYYFQKPIRNGNLAVDRTGNKENYDFAPAELSDVESTPLISSVRPPS